jgi:nucleotide-binding universal stress UspA family protein
MRILVAVTEESGPFLMKTLLGRTFSGDDEFRVVTVFDNGSIPYAKAKDGVPLFITELQGNVFRNLQAQVRTLHDKFPNSDVSSCVLHGGVSDAISSEAGLWQANLLVIGCHHRQGLAAWVVGSLSARVTRNSSCSLLIIPMPDLNKSLESNVMKILCAVDDSPCSEAAFEHLLTDQSWPRGSEFKIISIIGPIMGEFPLGIPYVTDKVALTKVKYPGSTVEGTTLEGFPTETILHTADWWHADLIVIGSHGRQGLSHFLLGSVSEAVARRARCSVEIIRAGANGPELTPNNAEPTSTRR